MVEATSLHMNVLPPAQRRLWLELGSIPERFVLYGGTAIALQLGHRTSIDFDFFTSGDFDPGELFDTVRIFDGTRVLRMAPNTLTVAVDRGGPVNLSLFGLPRLKRCQLPSTSADNGIAIASLVDLAATKLATILRRAEAKDYFDIDAILARGFDLGFLLAAARAVNGPSYQPYLGVKALASFEDGNLADLPGDLKVRLVRAAAAVELDTVDAQVVEPLGGVTGARI